MNIKKLLFSLTALCMLGTLTNRNANSQSVNDKNIVFIDYPGFPEQHSTWNDIGYSPTHNKVFVGVTDHFGKIALYDYDVDLQTMTNRGFIADLANLRDYQWQGKVHSKFVEGPQGEVYFSTDGGVYRSLHLRDHPHGYSGGYFMKWNPDTEKLTNLGIGMQYETLKDVDVDPHTGVLYGISFPQVHFLVYDPSTNERRDLGRLGGGHVPRVNFTDRWGNGYYVDWRQRLVKYEKSQSELIFARESLPAFPGTPGSHIITGITAYAKDREKGIIYLVTYGAKLLAFHPEKEGIGEVVDLGPVYELDEDPWRPYVPNLNIGDNGKLYYIIGGHGNFVKDNTTVFVEMDPKTGKRTILYEFPVSEIAEATGSDIKDKDGNLYFAGRKRNPGQEPSSTPFMIKFNPEEEVQ